MKTDVTTAAHGEGRARSSRDWLVFSCSFPSPRSTPRVAVWRRLRRFGAVALKSGLYVLPATEECIEAMQWLAQEARAEGADPIVILAEIIEGLSEGQLVELFHDARREDYGELKSRVDEVAALIGIANSDVASTRAAVERLRADYQQLRRIDYFAAPEGRAVGVRIEALAEVLAGAGEPAPAIPAALTRDYVGRVWVTRPRPFVDRLACAWLIRRFIDRSAEIRYADASSTEDEVAFDMEPGDFSHLGNLCSFEVMVEAFGLHGPAIDAMAEIVHEIDLRDGRYARPEVAGIESVIEGWRDSDRSDADLEARGVELFDGVYASLARSAATGNDR